MDHGHGIFTGPKSVNGPCFVTGQHMIALIVLCRLAEKGRREIGDSRGDEREGQGRKENE